MRCSGVAARLKPETASMEPSRILTRAAEAVLFLLNEVILSSLKIMYTIGDRSRVFYEDHLIYSKESILTIGNKSQFSTCSQN